MVKTHSRKTTTEIEPRMNQPRLFRYSAYPVTPATRKDLIILKEHDGRNMIASLAPKNSSGRANHQATPTEPLRHRSTEMAHRLLLEPGQLTRFAANNNNINALPTGRKPKCTRVLSTQHLSHDAVDSSRQSFYSLGYF